MDNSSKPPEAGRRGRPQKANAGSKMLEAGLNLISARGIKDCRVDEITAAAGVGKGTFFN